ncbi:MAG: hypothetical protein JWM60_1519 [Solirubrobacterales bacterium]|jgi:hypothetical protein|nr:hypothetical protein [Solirubrobacterales bacterium]
MNRAGQERLREARKAAELAAMGAARRMRHRELALVELYLAEIGADKPRRRPGRAPLDLPRAPGRAPWQSSRAGVRRLDDRGPRLLDAAGRRPLDYLVPLAVSWPVFLLSGAAPSQRLGERVLPSLRR